MKTETAERIIHPIPPVYDENSRVLVLGSFPSVKSREYGFFYGHPQNRFWRVLARVFGESVPESIDEKKALLLNNRVALWDVIQSCEITGSADSAIRNPRPNDVNRIIKESEIDRIFTNGRKAHELYVKYLEAVTGIKDVCLPSTSPANAAWTFDKLAEAWEGIL